MLSLRWLLALRLPSSFADFADHLKTNTIGPTIVAQQLIKTRIPIDTMVFMSSDSASATEFRGEDGYEKVKAILKFLNLPTGLRHMQHPKPH
jgi:NAD(P)-dependent dehydrogenase (short-subunit alcohol dehydrogenase family)